MHDAGQVGTECKKEPSGIKTLFSFSQFIRLIPFSIDTP